MIKTAAQSFAESLGYRVQKFRPAQTIAGFLASEEIDTVIDVGANEGQYGSYLRSMGYRGEIVSLEPVSDVFRILSERTATDPHWRAIQTALGETEQQLTINVSQATTFSSIKARSDAAEAYESSRVARQEQIAVTTLDKIFSGIRGERTYLKIDTQGYEQQVLAGASQSLKSIIGVQMELPCRHLYADTWNLSEAIAFMEASGFALAQTHVVNFQRDNPHLLEEIDAVFVARDR